MEIAGSAVLHRAAAFTGAENRRPSGDPPLLSASRVRVPARLRGGAGFSDDAHLRYYALPARCGGTKEKEGKKRAKLLKGLAKDLSELRSMGFGVDAGAGVGAGREMVSEAAELLLAELNQMRVQDKEMKERRIEEKKMMKMNRKEEKANRMKGCPQDEDSSSSSSESESSDSECEDVVDMSRSLGSSVAICPQPAVTVTATALPQSNPLIMAEKSPEEKPIPVNKIEVCLGGKCKRSGAAELLQEFEKAVGVEGMVVGCKCMGKCKEGPNVRVLNHNAGEGSLQLSKNPLCIGVGLEDVGAIVCDFFAQKDAGLMAA